jgi:hypothetical protein
MKIKFHGMKIVAASAMAMVAVLGLTATSATAASSRSDSDAAVPSGFVRPGGNLVAIPSDSSSAQGNEVSPSADIKLVPSAVNVRRQGNVCGTGVVNAVSGRGPGTLTLTYTNSLAVQKSANVGVEWKWMSGGLGFDVTRTYTNTQSYAYPVPANEWWQIRAFPYYEVYTFDIHNGISVYGSGQALKPIGYCYDASRI